MPKPGKNEDVIVEGLAPSVLPPATATQKPRALSMPEGMLKPRALPEEVDSKRKSFWLGTLPGFEYQNTDFGGQSFPCFTADVNETPDGTERFRRFGNVVRLLPEEVQGILLDVAGKVIQAGKLRCKASKHYRWNPEDVEAGTIVYMVEVPDNFQPPAFRAATMKHFDKVGDLVAEEWREGPPPLVARRNREAVPA